MVDICQRSLPTKPWPTSVDLYGMFDLIAADPNTGIVGIQVTGPNGRMDHWRTLTVACADKADMWLACGGTIELWSWRYPLVKRGGKERHWVPRIDTVTPLDLVLGSVAS